MMSLSSNVLQQLRNFGFCLSTVGNDCALSMQSIFGLVVLYCCITWFPADEVTRRWVRFTGRQEALVCGVSLASHVFLKMRVGSFIMH